MPEPTAAETPLVTETPPAPKPKSFLDSIEESYRQKLDENAKPKPATPATPPASEPAVPPAQTPATPSPADDDEPKGMAPKVAADWKKLKGERNELYQKYKALQAELEAERAKPRPDPKEIDAIKQERDAYSERLQQMDVERHPKFQEYFANRTAATVNLAKGIVGADRAPRLQEILEMPEGAYRDAALEEMAGDLKPIQANRLGAVLVEYDKIRQEKAATISESRANFTKLQEEQQRKVQQDQAQYLKAFEEATARATDPKDGLPVFQKRTGDTEADRAWNRQVDESLGLARNIYQGKLDAPEIAKASLWSASAPLFLAQLNERNQVIDALQKQIASLKASTPTIAPGGNPPATNEDKYKNMSYIDAMVARVNDAGAFGR